jgi:hypothetical protein
VSGTATVKQISFITNLRDERVVDAAHLELLQDEKLFTVDEATGCREAIVKKVEAGQMIEWLLAQPKKLSGLKSIAQSYGPTCQTKAQATTKVPAKEGVYLKGELIYKVMLNRAGTKTYARSLTVVNGKPQWDYAPSMVFQLTDADRVTPQVAKAFGDLHHFCLCCGRELTKPASIEMGIGPVCAGLLGF